MPRTKLKIELRLIIIIIRIPIRPRISTNHSLTSPLMRRWLSRSLVAWSVINTYSVCNANTVDARFSVNLGLSDFHTLNRDLWGVNGKMFRFNGEEGCVQYEYMLRAIRYETNSDWSTKFNNSSYDQNQNSLPKNVSWHFFRKKYIIIFWKKLENYKKNRPLYFFNRPWVLLDTKREFQKSSTHILHLSRRILDTGHDPKALNYSNAICYAY